jgi:predicted HTH domain antitoxin
VTAPKLALAQRCEPDIRLAAAVHWYSRGLISQERAAQVAGLDRTDFLLALSREGVDVFAVDLTFLRRELADV